MEGWLDETTMLQPGLPIVDQESLSQHRLEYLVWEEVFIIVAGILLENVFDALRVRDQVGR